MRPIRVLHVIDKLSMDGVNPSSCAMLLRDWAGHLDPNKVELTVCTLRNPDPAGKILEEIGVHVDYIGHGKISLKIIPALTKIVNKRKIDILHLHGYSAANYGRLVARNTGRLNVVHEHAVLKIPPHQYIADLLLRRSMDAAVAVSRNVRDFMIHGRSIPKVKIHIIGNGIALERFQSCTDKQNAKKRKELGLNNSTRIIGTVTRLREEKGTIYLIRALPEILDDHPDLILIIVGDGPQRQAIETEVHDLQIDRHVKFLGFRTDVAELLSIFDMTVIPSLTEGFPLSLVEAMAAGSPVIATQVGGMADLGTDGKDVLFVPPASPAKIAEKVIMLLEDRFLVKRLSQFAQATSQKMSVAKSAEQLFQLYLQLLQEKH